MKLIMIIGVSLRAWAWEMVSFKWDGKSELGSFREVRAWEKFLRWELESEREDDEMRIKELKKKKN